ncbi:hypothetical protein EV201_0617 [Ancylomarina subtilis]|uniref:Uncharacterized protein n=1 Tax=Ancylomarina subtilis TaxID=1639035 RepID=A0A4Q7VJ36_9BACT|nr:hypothetical protein EV201_0617 [Ancylomarina subtilis]
MSNLSFCSKESLVHLVFKTSNYVIETVHYISLINPILGTKF